MSRDCCAHGCTATTKSTPYRKFYTLTQVRGSLTEWLLAFNQLDILADFTIRRKPDSFSICEMHFPSIQKNSLFATNDECDKKLTKETQTYKFAPKLMMTPVEIVDIQPEPMFPHANVPIDAINIPAIVTGQINAANVGALGGFVANLNPETQQISNNNIPGFIGTATTTPINPVPVINSGKSAMMKLRKIQPKITSPSIPEYIIDLNSLSTPPMINMLDMAGLAATTNSNQSRVGNVNTTVTSTSEHISLDSDDFGVETVSQDEDPIKIEDDDALITGECNHNYAESPTHEEDELESDIVRIQFPTNEADIHVDDDGNYVKFEVDEASSDKIETYCFFDDDNDKVTAKRRRVVSTDNGFQIVKLEIEPDRTVT